MCGPRRNGGDYQTGLPLELSNLTIGSQKNWDRKRKRSIFYARTSTGPNYHSANVAFPAQMSINAKRFGQYVRGHWAIESTLHWCLDVTFREDECRVRNRNSANNLAWLKRFALSLLKQQKDKHSIAMRCRIAGWNLRYLAQVLRIPTV
jgi:predicted transposase YbfD/YdcC